MTSKQAESQCECRPGENEGTFYCTRHKVRKTSRMAELCRTRPGFFCAWEHGAGPGQSPKGSGDRVAKFIATATGGTIEPCAGCEKRREALNAASGFARQAAQVLLGKKGIPSVHKLHSLPELAEGSAKLAGLIAARWPEADGIAGVPRSGMIVASQVAAVLGLPLFSLHEKQLTRLGGGRRAQKHNRMEPRKIVAVEDSINTGWSIEYHAGGASKDARILGTAAVYCTPEGTAKVDAYAEILPLPHWFAWHIFGADYLSRVKAGFDFDGILCEDCKPEDDDDSERYAAWIESPRPLHPYTGGVIPVIITARLAKYEDQTRRWLAKHNIRTGKLVMGPWDNNAQRGRECIGTWKAEQVAKLGLDTFVESDRTQAEIIHRKANATVLCPKAGIVYQIN